MKFDSVRGCMVGVSLGRTMVTLSRGAADAWAPPPPSASAMKTATRVRMDDPPKGKRPVIYSRYWFGVILARSGLLRAGSGLDELDGHLLGALDEGGEVPAHVGGHLLEHVHPALAHLAEEALEVVHHQAEVVDAVALGPGTVRGAEPVRGPGGAGAGDGLPHPPHQVPRLG